MSLFFFLAAAIQQMTKIQSGGSPVIFRPQQVVVQQMPAQQFAKSTQQGAQAPRIQQFISSGQSSATAAVLATQIIGQPGSGSTVTVATQPTVAKTLSVTITTSSLPSGIVLVRLSYNIDSRSVHSTASDKVRNAAVASCYVSDTFFQTTSLSTELKPDVRVANNVSKAPVIDSGGIRCMFFCGNSNIFSLSQQPTHNERHIQWQH